MNIIYWFELRYCHALQQPTHQFCLKMGHWTLDNTTMNDTFMHGLKTGLSLCGISTSFNANDQGIICFPHIVSICTRHMVDEATTTNYSDSIDDYSDSLKMLTLTPMDAMWSCSATIPFVLSEPWASISYSLKT